MLIKVLGATKEVGRSGFLIKDYSSVLLDYGILLQREPGFPVHVRPRDISAILVTHAHLDHVGMVPMFYMSKGIPHYMTPVTFKLSELLLYDLMKISGPRLPYGTDEIKALRKHFNPIYYGEVLKIGGFEIEMLNAGHIPGSGMIYVKGSKSILYTGDVNHVETRLTLPTERKLPEGDLVITESTYASTDHPDRREEEKRLIDFAKEVVERKGTLLIPSFSVGRAQEVALIFYEHNLPYNVYMDGMALKANEILLEHPEFLKNSKRLEKALNRIEFVESWGKRRRVVNEPCVIISPAGMLVGGAAVFYNMKIAKKSRNGIAMVAFQIPGTPGRDLLDKKIIYVDGKRVKVKAEVERFDLSSHSGRKELLRMFKEDIKGSPMVMIVHGERENCERLSRDLKELGYDTIVPERGDIIEI